MVFREHPSICGVQWFAQVVSIVYVWFMIVAIEAAAFV